MGLIYHGLPEEYVESLRDAFGIKCFVETGTLHGETARWAAQRFDRVITIEAFPELYQRAASKLVTYPNVSVLHGDTRQRLGELAATLPPSVVWLDAHYSGVGTAGEADECPLLGEIQALLPAWSRMYVLIDDARYFLAPPPPPHDETQWPSMLQVVNALTANSNRFVAVFEDIFVSVPQSAKNITMSYIQKGGSLNERVIGYRRATNSSLLQRIRNRLQPN